MTGLLVTGGNGRLGRSVVSGLADRGAAVISVDRTLPDDPTAGVAYHAVDLTDSDATRAVFEQVHPESVITLAAIAVPFSAPEHVILSVNTLIAQNVVSAATAVGARRVIAASSPTVLGYGAPGWLPPAFPLDESTPPQPRHAYGLSKLMAEEVIRMHARCGHETRYAAFRPCYVIAPEEWAGAPTQQGHTVLERLDDPELSAPALFNYVDARDVEGFLARLLERMDTIPSGETFFVGAADALARKPLSELLPRFVPGSESLAAELTGTESAFSVGKAGRLLDWEPQHDWRTELDRAGAQ